MEVPNQTKKDSTMPAQAAFEQRAASGPGNLIVVTGPSGVGKGTLTSRLLDSVPALVKSVSVTTRLLRPGEQEGVDYFFQTRDQFAEMIDQDQLMEHAEFA